MALPFSTPPAASPFLTPDGTVSPGWYLFLSAILQTIGGPNVVTGGGAAPVDILKLFEECPLSTPDAVEALRAVDELRNMVYQQATQTADLIAIVDELRNEAAFAKNEVQSLRAVIDDLLSATAAPPQVDLLRTRVADLEDRLA